MTAMHSAPLPDIEIARHSKMLPIEQIAERIGIPAAERIGIDENGRITGLS